VSGFPKATRSPEGERPSSRDLDLAHGQVWMAGSVTADDVTSFALWRFDESGELAGGAPMLRSGDAGSPGADQGFAVSRGLGDEGGVWVAESGRSAIGNEELVAWRLDLEGRDFPGFPVTRNVADGRASTDCGQARAPRRGTLTGGERRLVIATTRLGYRGACE